MSDAGMLAMSPQSPAIFWQQSYSSAVICAYGSTHARTGDAPARNITPHISADINRCMKKFYADGVCMVKAAVVWLVVPFAATTVVCLGIDPPHFRGFPPQAISLPALRFLL